jgi:hypothetical protein
MGSNVLPHICIDDLVGYGKHELAPNNVSGRFFLHGERRGCQLTAKVIPDEHILKTFTLQILKAPWTDQLL